MLRAEESKTLKKFRSTHPVERKVVYSSPTRNGSKEHTNNSVNFPSVENGKRRETHDHGSW